MKKPLLTLSAAQKGVITKALNGHATAKPGVTLAKLRNAIGKTEAREQAKHIARAIIAEMEAAGSVVAR